MSRADVADLSAQISAEATRGLGLFITDIVVRVATPIVEAEVRRRMEATPPKFATSNNNPLRSKSAFRQAISSGKVPGWKEGRRYVAKWEEVERYMMSNPVAATARAQRAQDDIKALTAAARRGRGGKRRG